MRYILKSKTGSVDGKAVAALQKELKISEMLAKILCSRDICGVEEARGFLHPAKEQLHDPMLFGQMRDVVSLIRNKLATQKRICIYGDYDVDGASGCAILYMALKELGADVECILPSRLEHGYGLSMEAVEDMKGRFELLITVDCGITNVAEIDRANELGIDCIVTDHHVCPPVLPAAKAILNAKCDGETYPYKELCGAGVAFKLAVALIGDKAFEFIDIAAVATIADIVPLTGENRVIAKLGLDKLNEDPNPGIKWLVKKSGIRCDRIDSQTVAYSLAPRINAAGRISTANIAFELMTETNEGKLEQIAEELCKLNADRQGRQEKVVQEAMEREAANPGDKLIVHYDADWDVGIIGLAASKLVEKYNKPAILFGSVGDMYTGSARSIDGVNIFEALATQSDLYEKFGGHSGAAGLTLKEGYIPVIKERINQFLKQEYTDEVFLPVKYYDIEMEPGRVTSKLISELDQLQPYGHKNGQVEVLVRRAALGDIRAIGEDKHARFVIRKNKYGLNAVKFGTKAINIPAMADIVGTVQINNYDNLPQMIANTLSFDPSNTQLYGEAWTYIHAQGNPVDREAYFCGREKLLRIHAVLRAVMQSGMEFENMEMLLKFLQKHVSGLNARQEAFAFSVFMEIKLLEIKKGDKIKVVLKSGRRNLEDSNIYNKFYLEG